jgi:hypothetical protein
VEHRSSEDLDQDQMLTLALIKAIETVGEAASNAWPVKPSFDETHTTMAIRAGFVWTLFLQAP